MENSGRSYIIKKAFADAYLELAKEKPLRKISVADLANRCGLSRVTFITTSAKSMTCCSGPTPAALGT